MSTLATSFVLAEFYTHRTKDVFKYVKAVHFTYCDLKL